MKPETRTFAQLELRATADARKIEGYAAVFNTPTDICGMFTEIIMPGAFRKAIPRDDVRALVNHDENMLLGRNRSGTLRMSEDSTGLHVEIMPPDTQMARDLIVSMERGDINQMSFGFIADMETWDLTEDVPIREVDDVQLFDVSVVTYPAYPETSAAVRSLEQRRAQLAAESPVIIPDKRSLIKTRLQLRQAHFERGLSLNRA